MVFEDTKIMSNHNSYTNNDKNYDYKHYLETLLDIIHDRNNDYNTNKELYKRALETAILLGPEEDTKIEILKLFDNDILSIKGNYHTNYGIDYFYNNGDENRFTLDEIRKMEGYIEGGSRRIKASPKSKPSPKSKAKPKHDEMTMKDIKEMCKANEIKLSKVVEGKRVAFKKKELITKLKRKKLL